MSTAYQNATAIQLRDVLEELRQCADVVRGKFKLSPGGDAYTYEGSTSDADHLRDAIAAAEELWLRTTPDDGEEL